MDSIFPSPFDHCFSPLTAQLPQPVSSTLTQTSCDHRESDQYDQSHSLTSIDADWTNAFAFLDSYQPATIPNNDGQSRYELRNVPGTLESTWLDDDESGNFDPFSKPRAKKRKKSNATERYERAQENKKMRIAEAESICIRNNHVECPLVVTIKTDGSNELIKLVSAMRHNWPESACVYEPSTEPSRSDVKDEMIDRQTRHGRAARPSETITDLIGHPEARGCWNCYHLGHRCSIVHEEEDFHYPCEECEDNDEECELIKTPRRKRGCETCRRLKTPCSYTHTTTTDWSTACERCTAKGFKCIAGPAKGFEPRRISYSRYTNTADDFESSASANSGGSSDVTHALSKGSAAETLQSNLPGSAVLQPEGLRTEYRRAAEVDTKGLITSPVTQNQAGPLESTTATGSETFEATARTRPCSKCLREGTRCSSIETDGSIPCIACRMSRSNCDAKPFSKTPIKASRRAPVQRPQSQKIAAGSSATSSHSLTPSPVVKAVNPAEPIPTSTPRRSRLPKPIIFNARHCSFCTTASLPILGPRRQEQANTASSSLPPTLASTAQATSSTRPPTALCCRCTLTRMTIYVCRPHNLVPLTDCTPPSDFSSAFWRLVANRPTDGDVWCSICPMLASFVCCKPDSSQHRPEQQKQPGREGQSGQKKCGLALCASCAAALGNHGGQLGELLKQAVDQKTASKLLGLRADLELLKGDGEIVRFLGELRQKQQQRNRGVGR